MSERSLGGVRKDQARVPRDIDWLAVHGDDRAVTQLGEDLALLAYAIVASCVGRDLQDALLRVSVANEQRDGGRPATKALDHLESGDDVTWLRGERMDFFGLVGPLRFGEFVFDERDAV